MGCSSIVNRSQHICQGCRDLAMHTSGADEQLSSPTTGHCQISRARALICHSCSVRANRNAHHCFARLSGSSASVNVTSEHGELTLLSPPPPRLTSQASQASSQFTSRVSDSIILPDYVRAVETESHCFIEGCQRQVRNRVPVTIRKILLDHYKFYINSIKQQFMQPPFEYSVMGFSYWGFRKLH